MYSSSVTINIPPRLALLQLNPEEIWKLSGRINRNSQELFFGIPPVVRQLLMANSPKVEPFRQAVITELDRVWEDMTEAIVVATAHRKNRKIFHKFFLSNSKLSHMFWESPKTTS